jgi:hypothetical protein
MKKKFYVNSKPQESGEHEVHTETCIFLPSQQNQIYLGEFEYCEAAVLAAKSFYYNVDGCFYCSSTCHRE